AGGHPRRRTNTDHALQEIAPLERLRSWRLIERTNCRVVILLSCRAFFRRYLVHFCCSTNYGRLCFSLNNTATPLSNCSIKKSPHPSSSLNRKYSRTCSQTHQFPKTDLLQSLPTRVAPAPPPPD